MKENIKDFCNLLWLVLSCIMCFEGIPEIIHLIAIEEYWLSLFILTLTLFFFCIGVNTFGILKEQIKFKKE